eukprot:COSAG02_NODE_2794_length_8016_cov_5.159783_11_plen_67_part_00
MPIGDDIIFRRCGTNVKSITTTVSHANRTEVKAHSMLNSSTQARADRKSAAAFHLHVRVKIDIYRR